MLPGFPVLLIPHLVYLQRTGGFMPQGVVPQNIIRYQGLFPSIGVAMATASDQIKGALLGILPSFTKIGSEGSAWIGAFPPALCGAGMVSMWRKSRALAIGSGFYLLLVLLADSFTTFSGVHYNRHLHVLSPLFFGHGLSLVRSLKGRDLIQWGVLGFWGAVIGLQTLASYPVCKGMVRSMAADALVAETILSRCPECRAFDLSARVQYWADGRIRWHTLTPAVDPVLGRTVKYFHRITELGEYTQRLSDGPAVLVYSPSNDAIQEWLLSFETTELATLMTHYTTVKKVSMLDLSALHDSPPFPGPVDEVDVGDPVSEHDHGYRAVSSLPVEVGGFPHRGEGFADGGRPSVVREEFTLFVPDGGGLLVARYRGGYEGRRLRVPYTPVRLSVGETLLTVTADGDTVFRETMRFGEGFTHLAIPLPRGGHRRIVVTGLVNSFHYWTFDPADAAPDRRRQQEPSIPPE